MTGLVLQINKNGIVVNYVCVIYCARPSQDAKIALSNKIVKNGYLQNVQYLQPKQKIQQSINKQRLSLSL